MGSLYLSSYGLGSAPHALAALLEPGARAALVMNALDGYGPWRPEQVAAHVAALAALGLRADEFDLRDYFGAKSLRAALDPYRLVWAVGGNSFVLRRAMRASGLDALAIERVGDGSLVWGGFSAGAIVATPTLRAVDVVDDPSEVPEGYARTELEWGGLGLVPFSIAPHVRSQHPESALVDEMVARFEAERMPYRALRDGEALVVRDGEVRVVGDAAS